MNALAEILSPVKSDAAGLPRRPAWIEVDLDRLRRNFQFIAQDKPGRLGIISVVKDEAYGHGAANVAKIALESGAAALAVFTLDEALALRTEGFRAPILCLGERHPDELPFCLEYDLTCCVGTIETAARLNCLARRFQRPAPVHVKINTGMNRYGMRWDQALPFLQSLNEMKGVRLDGILSHFAMSDELDKTCALLQLERFNQVLSQAQDHGIRIPCRHFCNSGGFLDLPQAHFDQVRLGLLPLGVYPSKVCRRIPGIEPVMSIKARVAAFQNIVPGESVGYGMRFVASRPSRIAVVPIGYGDGYPRIRNQGWVLIHGQRAPLVGSVSMDALTVDVTGIRAVQLGDEVVVMGRQGSAEISVHELAAWKGSVSYDLLAGWRSRLPRVYHSTFERP
jgi:alanine racemase